MSLIFTDSRRYELLQLANFAAYIIRKKIYGTTSTKFDFEYLYGIVSTKLDRDNSGKTDGIGLKIIDPLRLYAYK